MGSPIRPEFPDASRLFIVNGANSVGVKTSEHPTLDEALGKASEFLDAGMFNVTILDLERKTFQEAEIEMLIAIARAERERKPKS